MKSNVSNAEKMMDAAPVFRMAGTVSDQNQTVPAFL